jgi:hypothetical protein
MKSILSVFTIVLSILFNFSAVNTASAEIDFRVVDAAGMGRSTAQDGIFVQLTRRSTSATELVSGCWINDGCTDANGYGEIVALHPWNPDTYGYDAQPLPAGRYDLSVYGPGLQLARRTIMYDGTYRDMGEIVLHPTATRITLKSDYLQSVPISGGSFSAQFDIAHNLNIERPFTAKVRVVVSTPAVNSFTNLYGLPDILVTLEPNGSVLFTSEQIPVPARLPDGGWTCINLSLTEVDDATTVLGMASACAVKGMNMAFLPNMTY